jgi:hypothetical protein
MVVQSEGVSKICICIRLRRIKGRAQRASRACPYGRSDHICFEEDPGHSPSIDWLAPIKRLSDDRVHGTLDNVRHRIVMNMVIYKLWNTITCIVRKRRQERAVKHQIHSTVWYTRCRWSHSREEETFLIQNLQYTELSEDL